MGLCFLFFLSHYLAPLSIASRWIGGWTSFFSTTQRFRRTLHLMITLVFNDCMEWIIIPQWDGYHLGWYGQKISFPLPKSTVPLVAIKRGWLDAEDMQDFPYLRLRLKLTFPSPGRSCVFDEMNCEADLRTSDAFVRSPDFESHSLSLLPCFYS